MKKNIWIWQRIISPHMTNLAINLAKLGCKVVYVAERPMTEDRIQQGWSPPILSNVELKLITSEESIKNLLMTAPSHSVHICSGIRGNGLIGSTQKLLARHQLQQWVVMETVEDSGWRGLFKRLEYRRCFSVANRKLQGILAIGHSTPNWIIQRGMSSKKVFPFAYFLENYQIEPYLPEKTNKNFRILYAGQFIKRKQIDLLIEALSKLVSEKFELALIGSGPLETELRLLASEKLTCKTDWVGRLPIESISVEMAKADCLVLPSNHDGWGAVVSEALMVGTPVICSDACGSAGVVRASGFGGVFHSGNSDQLRQLLSDMISFGKLPLKKREALKTWANCLSGEAGATYLMQILDHVQGENQPPLPPWEKNTIDTKAGK